MDTTTAAAAPMLAHAALTVTYRGAFDSAATVDIPLPLDHSTGARVQAITDYLHAIYRDPAPEFTIRPYPAPFRTTEDRWVRLGFYA